MAVASQWLITRRYLAAARRLAGHSYAGVMAMTPEQYHAYIMSHADEEGRLPPQEWSWGTFPFEGEKFAIRPLQSPVVPEPERRGESSESCRSCTEPVTALWTNENWRLFACKPTGLPVLMMLQPRDHYDFADLPDGLAAEMGVLLRHIASAVEGIDNIERVHIDRWGDGSAHLHWFVAGRPTGQLQLRGTFGAVWELILPPLPLDELESNHASVAGRLFESYGGQLLES